MIKFIVIKEPHPMIKNIKSVFLSPEFYEIYAPCMFEPTYEKFQAKAERFVSDPSVSVLAYFEGERALGVIAAEESDEAVEILGIAVEESSRHRGIGSALANSVLRMFSKKLIAETDGDAVDFYRKNGFEVTEFTACYSGEITRYRCEKTEKL
jgi:ribosomal protein S18 acetylase RimI-like enzyme